VKRDFRRKKTQVIAIKTISFGIGDSTGHILLPLKLKREEF